MEQALDIRELVKRLALIESEGVAFYRSLAKHTGNEKIKKLAMTMVKVETKHQERFEELDAFWEGAEDMFMPLSNREMEILQLITRGMSNKEIAIELGISHQTVKNHMTSILRKLAVNDRTQAAIYALRKGWVRLQDTGE